MICTICGSERHQACSCPRRFTGKIAVVGMCLMLGACADKVPVQPVTVTSDSFCKIAEKQSWSVNDTLESIDKARRANAKIDRLCQSKETS